MSEKQATIKQVMEFFGMTSSEFTKQWRQLTETDKVQLKNGIGDGTLTY